MSYNHPASRGKVSTGVALVTGKPDNKIQAMDFADVPVSNGGVADDAFHGTSKERAEEIVKTQRMKIRGHSSMLLGNALYFYVGDPEAAQVWAGHAKYLKGDRAVLTARVKLGNTINSWLLEPRVPVLKRANSSMKNMPDAAVLILLLKACKQYHDEHRNAIDSIRFWRKFTLTNRNVLVLAVYDETRVSGIELCSPN
jgi:hypothetical protein